MHRIPNWDNQIIKFWCWGCICLSFVVNTFNYFIITDLISSIMWMRWKWQKAPVTLHLLYFYCVSIRFLSFLFHFILKRYVFIFACAVVFWLEQDGVHKIVHPIHTRFLNKKCNFCWNIFHIKHIRNVMILQHRMKSWSAECFNIM